MDAGFQSFLPGGGGLQLDSKKRGMTLVKSGTITNANFPAFSSSQVCSMQISIGGGFDSPIVFFKATGADSRVACQIRPSNVGAGWANSYSLRFFKWWNLSIAPVDYYVFAAVEQDPSNFGLQLFGDDGALNFDANWNNLYIKNILTCPPRTPSFNVSNFPAYAMPSGLQAGTYAVGLANARQATLSGQGVSLQGWALMDSAFVDGNIVKVNWIMIEQDETGFGKVPTVHVNDTSLMVMLADIRNLPLPYG